MDVALTYLSVVMIWMLWFLLHLLSCMSVFTKYCSDCPVFCCDWYQCCHDLKSVLLVLTYSDDLTFMVIAAMPVLSWYDMTATMAAIFQIIHVCPHLVMLWLPWLLLWLISAFPAFPPIARICLNIGVNRIISLCLPGVLTESLHLDHSIIMSVAGLTQGPHRVHL